MRPPALYRTFTSREQIDDEYDIRRAVPDAERHLARYVQESARTRAELDCRLGIHYGPTLPERLDVFPAAPEAPVLVFIHGGYWRSRSPRDFSCMARGPVAAGVTVVLVGYALCPQVTIDEIVRQARSALAWIHEHAGELSGDRDRIHVAGHSAGGHLVGMLLATDWEPDHGVPGDAIKGACTLSGLFDLAPFPHSFLQPALRLTAEQVQRCSPIRHLPDDAGPLIVTYGGRESSELRRQSEDFLAAWRARGLPAERVDQPDRNHYTAIEDFLDAGSPLCRAVIRQIEGK